MQDVPSTQVQVDCFLLADSAQESAGKLYVLGGGWDNLRLPGPETQVPSIALAMRVVVPWGETNRLLRLPIQLLDPDGNELIQDVPVAELNVGRPAGLAAGATQHIPLALTFNNVSFPRPGTYAFIISLEGRELARARFEVVFPDR